jgi:hypothetical protein
VAVSAKECLGFKKETLHYHKKMKFARLAEGRFSPAEAQKKAGPEYQVLLKEGEKWA